MRKRLGDDDVNKEKEEEKKQVSREIRTAIKVMKHVIKILFFFTQDFTDYTLPSLTLTLIWFFYVSAST